MCRFVICINNESYLYPISMFAPIVLPEVAERALMAAEG